MRFELNDRDWKIFDNFCEDATDEEIGRFTDINCRDCKGEGVLEEDVSTPVGIYMILKVCECLDANCKNIVKYWGDKK